MFFTAFFFVIVGGAAMAFIAVNEYYDKKSRRWTESKNY